MDIFLMINDLFEFLTHTQIQLVIFIIENLGLGAVFIDIKIQIRIRFGMANSFNRHLKLKISTFDLR